MGSSLATKLFNCAEVLIIFITNLIHFASLPSAAVYSRFPFRRQVSFHIIVGPKGISCFLIDRNSPGLGFGAKEKKVFKSFFRMVFIPFYVRL